MRRLVLLAVLTLLAAPFAARAQSGRTALIDDPIKVEFKNSPPGLTMERLNELIAVSAAARQWQRVADDDGRMQLLLVVKGAHQMRVELAYHPRGYTIKYLDSVNMNYREELVDGLQARVIHKRYNQWVHELAKAINSGLGVSAQIVTGP